MSSRWSQSPAQRRAPAALLRRCHIPMVEFNSAPRSSEGAAGLWVPGLCLRALPGKGASEPIPMGRAMSAGMLWAELRRRMQL